MSCVVLRLVTAALSAALVVLAVAPDASAVRQAHRPEPSRRAAEERARVGEAVERLQMSLRPVREAHPQDESPEFEIAFRNAGHRDLMLNLGLMLANGEKGYATAIRLLITDGSGRERELRLMGPTGIAGRVDDFIVPLPVGGSYALRVPLKDYWCPDTKEFRIALPEGQYEIVAVYEGNRPQAVNSDMEGIQLMSFWTGRASSNASTFSVVGRQNDAEERSEVGLSQRPAVGGGTGDPLAAALNVPGATATAEEIVSGIRVVFTTEDPKQVDVLRIRVMDAAEGLTGGGEVKSLIELIEGGAALRLTSDVPYVVGRLRDQVKQMVRASQPAAGRDVSDALAAALNVRGATAAAEQIGSGIRIIFTTEDPEQVHALRIRAMNAAPSLTRGGQVKSAIELIDGGAVLRLTSDVPYVVDRLRDQVGQMLGRSQPAAGSDQVEQMVGPSKPAVGSGVGDAPAARPNAPPVTLHEDLRAIMLRQRGKDLRTLDLRNVDLTRTTFDSSTQWPSLDRLPPGFDPDALMERGKYPGLGIRTLHDRGITGKGVHVAIIDQPLLKTHVEYRDQLASYTEVQIDHPGPQMHGPAVASLFVGKSCGVAPGAILHYWAEPSWKRDYRYRCEALEQILEYNKGKPLSQQIRVVSVSKGFSPDEPHLERWKELLAAAKKSGAYVIHCSRDMFGVGAPPFEDSDVAGNYQLCAFYERLSFDGSGVLFAPVDNRTTASCGGQEEYIFWSKGGLSWGAPYIAGVAALGLQVNPGLTETQIERLLYESGRPFQKGRLIDPVGFAQEAHRLRR